MNIVCIHLYSILLTSEGGLDIVKELIEADEFRGMIEDANA